MLARCSLCVYVLCNGLGLINTAWGLMQSTLSERECVRADGGQVDNPPRTLPIRLSSSGGARLSSSPPPLLGEKGLDASGARSQISPRPALLMGAGVACAARFATRMLNAHLF